MNFEFWQPYLISIAMGLLVGIERERAKHPGETLGVRTFLLIALLGSVAGGVGHELIAAAITLLSFTLIAISYYATKNHRHPDFGLTTEFAAGIVFSLGFLSHTEPILTALLGPIVALVLFSKLPLHRFTKRLKPSEIRAALLLLLLAVAVLLLLPNRIVDPWGILNPRKFGGLIVILGTLEFASYVLGKVLAENKSALLLGFLGGLVSSTAVLLASARQARKAAPATALVSAIASQIASFAELIFLVSLVSPALAMKLSMPVGLAAVFAFVPLIYFFRQSRNISSELALRSPLEWKGVIRLALLFAFMLVAMAFAKRFFGETATSFVSILGGTFEIHGATLANSVMFMREQISLESAVQNIRLAVAANLVAKLCICWIIARNRFTYILTGLYLVLALILWVAA